MNLYCFEVYMHDERGSRFLGTKRIEAESTEVAKLSVLDAAGPGATVCQVYINPGDPYAR
jgi:hypothetical protein